MASSRGRPSEHRFQVLNPRRERLGDTSAGQAASALCRLRAQSPGIPVGWSDPRFELRGSGSPTIWTQSPCFSVFAGGTGCLGPAGDSWPEPWSCFIVHSVMGFHAAAPTEAQGSRIREWLTICAFSYHAAGFIPSLGIEPGTFGS